MHETKICLRSGQCCSGYFAFVPKTEESDLSPAALEKVEDFTTYLEEHAEPMGEPCKWLTRDKQTTEATCKAHERKSDMCLSYPENIFGEKTYCNIGVHYWQKRQARDLPVPEWIEDVLKSL